jgi:hypothetical protein
LEEGVLPMLVNFRIQETPSHLMSSLPHLGQEYAEGFDIRPTISMTMSHLKIPELDQLYREGKLQVDGKIVLKTPDLPAFPGVDQGIEVNVCKASIDPVWHLPSRARRLSM